MKEKGNCVEAASSPLYFPLFVDLTRKNIVVVGGGNIASRRVRALLSFTGGIIVVSPESRPELEELRQAGKIELRRRNFQPEDLDGADLVLTATGVAEVDDLVWSLCKERNIPVNVCSDKAKCDFFFPGIAKKGSLVAGVTAGGTDHQLAKRVTEGIRRLLENLED